MRSAEAEVGDRGRSEPLHGSIADCAGVVGAACAFKAVDVAWLANNLHSIVVCAWSTKAAGSIGESLSHVAGQAFSRKETSTSYTRIMTCVTSTIELCITRDAWTRIRNELSFINSSAAEAARRSCLTCQTS